MDGFLIIGVILAICFAVTVIVACFSKPAPNRKQIVNDKKKRIITNQIVEMISQDFANAGWDEWDPSIHAMPEQLERLRKATDSVIPIQLFQYNPKNGIAKMRGSGYKYYLVSGHRCSCPDFRDRQLPCKHMYCLATMLPNYKEYLDGEKPIILKNACDDVLFGLKFNIVGRNQKPVKDFIIRHGGTYGKDTWREITAVVVASETLNQRIIVAQERYVEVMTFDELKVLFTTYTNEQ